MTQQLRSTDGHWYLNGELNFHTVNHLLLQGIQALQAAEDNISVDLSHVSYSDSAGLALFLEWTRIAKTLGKTISFHKFPPQMRAIAELCNVFEAILGS